MTMFDAQSAIGLVLKPPTGFEELYDGLIGTTPIPFVAAPFEVLDERAGARGIASNLVRFVPVPLGGTGLIIIPRALYQDGVLLRAPSYVYDFRWRLRTVADNVAAVTEGNATHPFNMLAMRGAPSAPDPTERLVLPAYTSETVTPAVVGSTARPLVAAGEYASVSQGVYALADFVDQSDAALGPNFFPPYLRALLGNELGIVATKASGNWAFEDTGATGDAAFSNVYGINVAGTRHAAYPGVGIVLITVARPTSG